MADIVEVPGSKRSPDTTTHHTTTQTCNTHVMLKSVWYVVSLTVLMLLATIVFMGIEGFHDEAVGYEKLNYQFEFTKRAESVLCNKEHLGDECFDKSEAVKARFDAIYRNLTQASRIRCSLAGLMLTNWNNKTDADALMYAISIVSTVGWGVYTPPTTALKILTLLYAVCGLPLFAALIGFTHEGVRWLERRMIRLEWVRENVSSTKALGLVALLVMVVFVGGYGVICFLLLKREQGTWYADLLQELSVDPPPADGEYGWSLLTGIWYVFTTIGCIGFGDVYVYDPHHAVLFLKPLLQFVAIALVIALLSLAFQSAQRRVDKTVETSVTEFRTNNLRAKSVKYDRRAKQQLTRKVTINFNLNETMAL